jgi:putative addiction module component (TIGR02574 family)
MTKSIPFFAPRPEMSMELQDVILQIEAWTIEDRLQLIERIWDGLLNDDQPSLSNDLKTLLDQRLEEDDNAPDDVVSWEEVRSEVLKRIGRGADSSTRPPRNQPNSY